MDRSITLDVDPTRVPEILTTAEDRLRRDAATLPPFFPAAS